jgi:hypothetical protein
MSRLKSIAAAVIVAIVAITVSAGPALASTVTPPLLFPTPHHPVPVGSIAGGLGVAAIAGIGLLVAQRRRRRPVSPKL